MGEPWILPSVCQEKEFVVQGNLATARDWKGASPAPPAPAGDPGAAGGPPGGFPMTEVLTAEQVAGADLPGLDRIGLLRAMNALGPDARLLLLRRGDQVIRHEVFRDPRICRDVNPGAVIENLTQPLADRSGWRVQEFYIDPKGCLGDECGRCAIVCPENAIHLRGSGKGSFHEIDPAACKGCFICWVECVRTAADCIVIDGKTFDPGLRARHFGE
jgi:Pyruvate/2-oxoacid:ferredoxin oxidoreductase delta subunit